MSSDASDLPLFSGPHIPRVRLERALERLDLAAAAADAPPEWQDGLAAMAHAVGSGGLQTADLGALAAVHREGWPAELERTWQRLVGLHLDGHGVPGVHAGELAAAYLLRGGERQRAERSVQRHVRFHPGDLRGWRLFAEFDPVRGAVRSAFHGGELLAAADELAEMAREDGNEPVHTWLLSYGWFERALDLDFVADALTAEGILRTPPIPMPGDGRAFAWFLLDAGGRPLGPGSEGVVAARERLQRISPAAFRRYLARAGRRSPR